LVKPLVLPVDATTEPLKRSLRDGKATLADFGKDAEASLKDLRDNFSREGASAGAELAAAMSKGLTANLRTMKAQAQAALDMGKDFDPLGGMSSTSSLQAAAAQTKLAATYRERADAASRATAADEQQALGLKQLAVAMELAAQRADVESAALRTQAQVFAALEAEMGETVPAADAVAGAHGRVGASGMLMMHSIRSASDSFAAGLPLSMIFAEQMGRLGEAAAMSEGALGSVGAIMSGPWGIAILGGISVLSVIIGKSDLFTSELDQNKKALQDVKLASDGLKDVQSILGEVFDLTTGKIKHQSEALMELAHAQLLVAKAKAETDKAEAAKTLNDLKAPHTVVGGGFGGGLYLGRQQGPEADFITNFQAGKYATGKPGDKNYDSGANATMDALAALQKSGKISMETYLSGISAISSYDMNSGTIKLADDGLDSLKTGSLDPSLRNPKTPRTRHPADHSFQDANSYAKEMDTLADELAKAKRANVTDVEQLAALDKAEVDAALKRQKDTIAADAHQHKWTDAQKDAADQAADEVAAAKKEAIDRKTIAELVAHYAEIERDTLSVQNDLLQAQGQLATTTKERLAIALQILANEKKSSVIGNDSDLATGKIDEGQYQQRALDINNKTAAQAKVIQHQNAGPLDQFGQQLHQNTDDMNSSLQSVEVDGLKGLEDGLTGLISGTESVASAFKKMAASIIADLARIAIEKALVSFLGLSTGGTVEGRATGGLLGFATGGLPGYADGVRLANGMIKGPGTGTSDSVLALVNGRRPIRVSNDEGIVNARAVRNYWPLIDAMNKGTFPRFASGGALGDVPQLAYPKAPSVESLRTGSGQVLTFDLRGAVVTEQLLRQMQDIANASAARMGTAVLAAAPALSQNEITETAMQRIPS
jgi:hypothetical protein